MTTIAQVTELLRQGIAAAKAGREQEARHVLLQVTDLDERNEQAWLWLSGIVESLEDRRVCLENVLAINPNNSHAQAGLRWLEQHAPASSPDQDHCPHCGSAVPPAGVTCPRCRQPLLIICPDCERYVDIDQSSCGNCEQFLGDFRQGAHYYLTLAQAYVDGRKPELAQGAIERAEGEAPDDPQVLERLATLYEAMGRIDSAIVAYERAIELAPDNAALYARLGAIYRQRSKTSAEARAMYERAAELAGEDPAVLFELARFYTEEESTKQEAIRLLKQIIHLDPRHIQAHLHLGNAYLSQKRRKEAYKHYEQVRQLASPDSDIGREIRHKLAVLQLSYSKPRRRPGCVTAYAAFMGINALLTALGAILMGIAMVVGRSSIEETMGGTEQGDWVLWASIVIALAISALSLTVAIGLWNLKNWARITVIVLQILGLLGNSFPVCIGLGGISEAIDTYGFHWLFALLSCGFIAILAIGFYVIFWFAGNRDLFD